MYIGNKMKELRKIRNMSLTDLAEQSGVQIATLSRIEHNKMVGSLESHIKIAKSLEVDVTYLYSDINREESKMDMHTAGAGSDVFVHSDKSSYEILTSKILSKKMMPVMLKIDPGGQTPAEQNPPGSEKFVYVLEGMVDAVLENETFPLSAGNSMYMDASRRHWFVNKGSILMKALCVTTPMAL